MDNQLIFDLWTAIISASRILDTDKEFAAHLEQRLKEMAPMQVGHWGQLQEWMFDWDDPNDVHRHVSIYMDYSQQPDFSLPHSGTI